MPDEQKGKCLSISINDYTVFDLETTGLDTSSCEIIEIAAIKVRDSNVISDFSSFVRPINAIPKEATNINGITDAMVQDAPSLDTALTNFIDFIGNDILVGHNIDRFDIPIIDRTSKSVNRTIGNDYIDTIPFSKNRVANLCNYRLGTIASYFSIVNEHAHNALSDCMTTQKCYELLKAIKPLKDIGQYKNPQKNNHRIEYTDETKSLQLLQGFLLGVIADNKLKESEVLQLKSWLDKNKQLEGNYPFDRVFRVIEAALEDGVLTQNELDEMLQLFRNFTSPVGDIEESNIDYSGKLVCLSGEFNAGTKACVKTILNNMGMTLT